ncbi:aminoglycoside phosphotransferase family protein [Bdellovibrio sp. SKB1291214]|uniref:aminoglycoside phosphotransferase family protein n=1 Tax=Bdellovibrio sp. SKB1291214 TaxID=1732569 RepID=UPI00223EBC6F|nr:aminoglycoside phosphotransferase family protein [Bdellovibrio sp. SKB1291214]UYL09066.1 aminoglycoside phosphotransferase family protein [Bdellovibrio sp. SKB1291214]
MISRDSNLYKNIVTTWKAQGEQWLLQFPSHIQKIEALWNLEPIKPLDNLSFHFVGTSIRKSDGIEVVVKTGCDIESLDRERQWLRHFGGVAAQVIESDKALGATLMERLIPGETLKQSKQFSDDEQTIILANMIRELNSRSIISGAFKHIAELSKDLDVLKGAVDSRMLDKAKGIISELTLDRSQDCLLHGDLHHDNVLKHKHSWKVIDPHGYVGDPTFEMAVMMYNPLDSYPVNRPLRKTLERRMEILNEHINFDMQKMKAWAFAAAMISTAWDYGDTKKLLGIPFLVAQELRS